MPAARIPEQKTAPQTAGDKDKDKDNHKDKDKKLLLKLQVIGANEVTIE